MRHENDNFKLKILTLVSDLDKGGAQRAAINFADGYKKLGNQSKILAVNKGGIRQQKLNKLKINFWVGLVEKNIKEIKKWNPDVIHIHTTGINLEQINNLKAYLPTAQIIEKNVFSKPSDWQDVLSISFQMSSWCAWNYINSKKSKHNIVSVLPNPVNTADFYPSLDSEINQMKNKLKIPKENIVIGRIGQSYLGKWSTLLIKIFEEISQENDFVNLILVDPPKEIENMAKSSISARKIRIIREIVDDNDLKIIYSLIDIFALIADQGESFGNVLAESMLCETPIVTLSTPWCDNSQCEVVGHNEGGLVTLSPRGFKLALIELIRNKDLRTKLGEKGRIKVINSYDYLNVCKEVLNKLSNFENKEKIFKVNISKILSIYKDSFDEPNLLTLALIRFNYFKSFTRISTGYQNIFSFFKRYLKIINKKILFSNVLKFKK